MSATRYPFDRFLVPVRPPVEADRGLACAAALARRTGVPICLLSVGRPVDVERIARAIAATGDPDTPPIELEAHVAGIGSVAAAITGATEPGTLVCMSSHGAYGPGRTLAGTITEQVVRSASDPVLLVGPRVRPVHWWPAGPIVACLDDTDGRDDATVDVARHWSRAFGCPLRVAHVDDRGEGAPVPSRVDDDAVLHGRHPARAFARLAATEPVALFVMAPAARVGWGRVLAGSVTASTVSRAAAPVLAVPPRARADRLARARSTGIRRGIATPPRTV